MSSPKRKTFEDYVSPKDLEQLNDVDKERFLTGFRKNIKELDDLFAKRSEMDKEVFLKKRAVLYTDRTRLLSKYLRRTDYYERCKVRSRGRGTYPSSTPQKTPERAAKCKLYSFLASNDLLKNYRDNGDINTTNWFPRWKRVNNSDGSVKSIVDWIENNRVVREAKSRSYKTPFDYGVTEAEYKACPQDKWNEFVGMFNSFMEQKAAGEFTRQWMSVKIRQLLFQFGFTPRRSVKKRG